MRRIRKPKRFKEVSTFEIYRQRIVKSSSFKLSRTVLFPALVLYSVYSWTWGNPETQDAITSAIVSVRYSAENLPQFMLNKMVIEGLPPKLEAAVAEKVNVEFPISIFNLDKEVITTTLSEIEEIEAFTLVPQGGGDLTIKAIPAVPVALLKDKRGYKLISSSGRNLSHVYEWEGRDKLPIITGEKASQFAHEIPILTRIAEPIRSDMMGFIRVGERRWDIMMNNGLLIMLPEKDAIAALQKVVEWEESHSITSRRLARIDLRIPNEPLFRTISEEDALLYQAFAHQNRTRP